MTPDPLLQITIKGALALMDTFDGHPEIGITLQAHGMLISGIIASERDFVMSYPLTDKILELRDSLNGGPAEFEILENDIPEFVHLSKAHFFIPGGSKVPYDDDGVFWRCRLSEVCGFHFGLLGLSNA